MTDLKTLIDKLDAPDDWDSIVRRWPSRSLPEVVAPRTIRNDRIRRAATAVAAMGMAAFSQSCERLSLQRESGTWITPSVRSGSSGMMG